MANDTKRSRGSKWSHEQTVVLATFKREAFLNNEDGRIVWKRISQIISCRFPDRIRSADQCRRRWDTLVKVYNHIEDYCIETGQDHWELDEDELASMKLDTAYRQDWYSIVKEVCSQRKRKERYACDVVAGKMSEGSNTGSHSDSLLPERTPVSHTLNMPPPVSTPSSTSECVTAPLDAEPSVEVSKFSPVEEIQQDQEPLQADAEERADSTVETPSEIEHVKTGSGLIVPRSLSRECPSHDQRYGAINVAGGMGYDFEDIFGICYIPPWNTDDSFNMATYMSHHMAKMNLDSTVSTTSLSPHSTVSEGMISRQSSKCNKPVQGLDIQSVSKEEQQSQRCALKVIELEIILCCDACIRRLRRKLEELDGVEKPVTIDLHNMKVSVTATAEPEDVLKQARMVKKAAKMWPQKTST